MEIRFARRGTKPRSETRNQKKKREGVAQTKRKAEQEDNINGTKLGQIREDGLPENDDVVTHGLVSAGEIQDVNKCKQAGRTRDHVLGMLGITEIREGGYTKTTPTNNQSKSPLPPGYLSSEAELQ